MERDSIYEQTLGELKRLIEQHVCPDGRSSLAAFCEAYGINRPNLVTVLGGKSEMSISLFVRVAEQLGKLRPGRVSLDVAQLDRMSLRTYLAVDYTAIMQTVLNVQFDK